MNKLSDGFMFTIILIVLTTITQTICFALQDKETDKRAQTQIALNTQYLIQYNRVEAYHKQWSENEPTEYRVTVYAGGDKVLAIIPGAKWCNMEVTKWERVKR